MRTLAVVAIGVIASTASAQEIRLPAGDARVSGRVVVAETGTPLAGAEVRLQGLNLPPDLAYRTHTDGNGNFAFENVYAREYRALVTKAGYYTRPNRSSVIPGERVVVREGQTLTGVALSLNTGGVISGRVVDRHGDPVDAIRVYAQRLQYAADGTRYAPSNSANDVTDDLGQFRVFALEPGDYLVAASGRSSGQIPLVIDLFTSLKPGETVPTYYPGTPDVGQAQVVSLSGGQETPVQIVLAEQRAVSVSGLVLRSDGSAGAGMEIGLNPAAGVTSAGRYGGKTAADGTFVLTGVPPGHYQVIVFTTPLPALPGSGQALRWGESGGARVVVGDEDVRDVAVVTTPGATVSGTVTFDRPFTAQSFQLSATPRELKLGTQTVSSGPIGPDGAFTLTGVHEGARISSSTSGWMVKSVLVDGREIGDGPLEVGGRTRLTGVRVTVTDRIPGISGVAMDERKQPLASQTVVIMRADGPPGVPADRVITFQSKADGAFEFRRLFPGEYVIGLMTDPEPGIQFSPEFQDRLRRYGRRFTIEEGGDTLGFELQPTKGLLNP